MNNYIELSLVNRKGVSIGIVEVKKRDISKYYQIGYYDVGEFYTNLFLKGINEPLAVKQTPKEIDAMLNEKEEKGYFLPEKELDELLNGYLESVALSRQGVDNWAGFEDAINKKIEEYGSWRKYLETERKLIKERYTVKY